MAATPSINYPASNPQNAPYGADRIVAEGTRYELESATAVGTVSTELLEKYMMETILDTTPTPFYTLLKLILSQTPQEVPDLEFVTHESGFQFAPLILDDDAAGQAGAANTFVTEDYVIDAASMNYVGLNMVVGFPTEERGTVIAIDTNTNTITVKSISGGSLPAASTGDQLQVSFGEMGFDGQSAVYNFVRPTTVPRFNYLQAVRVMEKWNRDEEQVWKNMGRTNYMEFKTQKLRERFQFEMAVNLLNGRRGQYASTVAGEVSRGMHGMWPWMQTYNAGYASVPTASTQATFEAFSHNTNFSGNVIHLVAHQEVINLFASFYKNQLVRYAPNDMTANLDLQAIAHGSRKFVLVPCNGFRAPGLFENNFRNRILAYDPTAIRPVKFRGRPLIEKFGPTKQLTDGDGSFNTFSIMGYQCLISFHMGNTEHSFAIDVNDL